MLYGFYDILLTFTSKTGLDCPVISNIATYDKQAFFGVLGMQAMMLLYQNHHTSDT